MYRSGATVTFSFWSPPCVLARSGCLASSTSTLVESRSDSCSSGSSPWARSFWPSPLFAAIDSQLFRQPLPASVFGVLQFGLGYALIEGFNRAPVSLVVLLFFIYPLLVTLGAVLLLGEEFRLVRGIILGVGIVGIALTIGVPGSAPLAGIVAGILAGVCAAGVILGARTVMTRWPTSPLMLTALMFMGPAIVLALTAPATSLDLGVNTSGWVGAAGAVLVSGVAAHAFYYTGLKLIEAGSAAPLGVLEPLVAVLLAFAVLGESLSGVQLLGGAVILIAVAMLGLHMMRPRPAPREAV